MAIIMKDGNRPTAFSDSESSSILHCSLDMLIVFLFEIFKYFTAERFKVEWLLNIVQNIHNNGCS